MHCNRRNAIGRLALIAQRVSRDRFVAELPPHLQAEVVAEVLRRAGPRVTAADLEHVQPCDGELPALEVAQAEAPRRRWWQWGAV